MSGKRIRSSSCLAALRDAAEARNDTITAEERRRPSCATGSADCSHLVSSNLTLQTEETACRDVSSNCVSSDSRR